MCDHQDLERARQYHQHQLEIAQELQDRAAQGRASSNLGEFMTQMCLFDGRNGNVCECVLSLMLHSHGFRRQDTPRERHDRMEGR